MMKVEIVMDEEKILTEGKYSLEDIYFTIDKAYAQKNLKKTDKGIYVGTGSKNDFANFGLVMFFLEDADWFMSNVKKWLWYNDRGENNGVFVVEDILKELVKAV